MDDEADALGSWDLADQVAIISGGASGIGEAIVRTMMEAGARVAIVDVNRTAAEKVAESLGDRALAISADVSVRADVERLVEKTASVFGPATILVHSAVPSNPTGNVLEMPLDDWERTIDVVLIGGLLLARAFAKRAIREGNGGRIINITSAVVERPRVNSSAYCSAKSGLTALTKVMALELGQYGINVNAVGPGLVGTQNLIANSSDAYRRTYLGQVPRARIGLPQDIANAVLFLASPVADYITGQALYIDGGYTAGNLTVAN
jgi:NAD(P)-dependent dehydrogenase (short-subunit alcohol dehydrogenase family)